MLPRLVSRPLWRQRGGQGSKAQGWVCTCSFRHSGAQEPEVGVLCREVERRLQTVF